MRKNNWWFEWKHLFQGVKGQDRTIQIVLLSLKLNKYGMAECAKRKQKKKKHKKDEQHNSFPGAIPQMEQVAEFGDKDILKFLIAAQSDDVETVQQYLEWGMPVDTKCLMFLDTALHKACRTGSLKATRLLLDWGANIHMKTGNMAEFMYGGRREWSEGRGKPPKLLKPLPTPCVLFVSPPLPLTLPAPHHIHAGKKQKR